MKIETYGMWLHFCDYFNLRITFQKEYISITERMVYKREWQFKISPTYDLDDIGLLKDVGRYIGIGDEAMESFIKNNLGK